MDKPSRYCIGIDLGTTNSVLAYIDSEDSGFGPPLVLSVPQVAAPGDVRGFNELPSFLYFPTEHDLATGSLNLPWSDARPALVAGVMAREQGALTPGRQIHSAKSWLCHPQADRRAKILPWQSPPTSPKMSPVEASSAYLSHLRDAWDSEMVSDGDAGLRCQNQDIVLTVPASFDEEARELTVEAAHSAGLNRLTLLEEPLAAFYAWMTQKGDALRDQFEDGDIVLVCDIGGGTSDFTLIRVRTAQGVEFERIAVGEHLLLGGDNLDVALAWRVLDKLGDQKLGLRSLQVLQRKCSLAKEQLLSGRDLDHVPITLQGSGRSLTGGAITTELLRSEVEDLLAEGFLPLRPAAEEPQRTRRTGLKELSLAYASDPAITRHLSTFLAQAAARQQQQPNHSKQVMVRPDAILFNGGFCTPAFVRERIIGALSGWFSESTDQWRPKVLNDEVTSSPVAIGAAHYGMVRRGIGKRVRAGNARSYYIGLRSAEELQGVCVLPSGVDEGTTLALTNRDFSVIANRPASFDLFSSRTRQDQHGAVVALNPEDVHRHAPLVTLLRYGRKFRDVEINVRLRANFTETGTLEIWCEAKDTPHRWKLQFELRREESGGELAAPMETTSGLRSDFATKELAAKELLLTTFDSSRTSEADPTALVTALEEKLGSARDSWPLATIRSLGDALFEVVEGRRISSRHEVRWLNLFGFCLRPGFGAPGDDRRIVQTRRLFQAGLAHPDDVQSQVEWLVLWRRLSGGLNASQQQELHRVQLSVIGVPGKKAKGRLNKQVEHEAWRLLASLELLTAKQRSALGDQVLAKALKEPSDGHWMWSLGRFGARVPLYGPLSCVVPAETASAWIEALMDAGVMNSALTEAAVYMGMRTDDPNRDISNALRRKLQERLRRSGFEDEPARHLEQAYPVTPSEAAHVFGESLPNGLPILSSLNCAIPVTALTSDWQKAV